MNASERVYNYLKVAEGLRLTADNRDGTWTIGYGHTYQVKPGDTCSELQALAWLHKDMDFAERCVTVLLGARQVNQGVFDALVDFTFNCGAGALSKSGILTAIKTFDMVRAGQLLAHYTHDHHGNVLPGLVARRQHELAWFNEGVTNA